MKKILSFIFTLFLVIFTNAQRNELGITLGGANVIGDVGKGNYINPFPTRFEEGGKYKIPISLGILYRFNFNPHMGLRLNTSYSRFLASDYLSAEQYKIDRKVRISNNILEGALLFEYNFFNINDIQETSHSPYIFGGVGVSLFNNKGLAFDSDKRKFEYVENGKQSALVLPFGIGYKYRFNYNWIISLETGFRYTNNDNLDYSNTSLTTDEIKAIAIANNISLDDIRKDRVLNGSRFGNLSNKDWYVITGLTLTYSFGRPACYCN